MQREPRSGGMERQIDAARRLINKGLDAEAIPLLQAVVDEGAERIDARYLLSLAQLHAGQLGAAMENASQMVVAAPDNPDGYALLGEIHGNQRQYDNGIICCQKALQLDAEHVSALAGLGGLLLASGANPKLAIEVLEKAVKLKSSFHPAQMNLALALSMNGRADEALKHGYKAIKLAPESTTYLFQLANIQQEAGDKKEAYRLLERALSLNPTMGEAYAALARSHKFTVQDRPLLKKMHRALESPMTPSSLSSLHFALGKASDDLGEWDDAFGYFKQANGLVHAEYDERAHKKEVTDRARFFTPAFFKKHADWGVASDVPIFIVGMARSGSTLVDQMLSAHPQVQSVGESGRLWEMIHRLCGEQEDPKGFPFCLDRFAAEDIHSLAQEYLADIQRNCAPGISRIVDKQLNNFSALGVIALAFPNAKVIHTYRHPLDTCLSCFFQQFKFLESMTWAFDFRDLGLFYRGYRRSMLDWKKNLPMPFLDVCYESVVEDPEGSIRRILDFCGLDWDPQVMRFYEAKRAVQTASLMQVREPIYKTSKARWKNYAKHLQPLVDALGDVLAEDAQELQAAGLKVKKSPLSSIKRLWQ